MSLIGTATLEDHQTATIRSSRNGIDPPRWRRDSLRDRTDSSCRCPSLIPQDRFDVLGLAMPWTGVSPPSVCKLFYECPRTVDADLAMLIANCRARGSALSCVCLKVASQRPWARQVLTVFGTMWSKTVSRVRELGKRLATSRSHKLVTARTSFR